MDLKSKTFQELVKYSWWVQYVLRPEAPREAKDLLYRLDKVAIQIETDEENAEIIQDKIKFIAQNERNYNGVERRDLSTAAQEKEDQLLAFFTELAVYDTLSKRGFESIKFLPERNVKQPDIKASRSKDDYFFEVKRIRRPSAEATILRTIGIYSSYPRDDFREGIKKKIDDFIKDADEKFNAVNAKKGNRQLILDYEVGIDAIVNIEGDDKRNLRKILGDKYFIDLEKLYGMTIEILNFDF